MDDIARRPLSGLMHLAAALAAVAGSVVLILTGGTSPTKAIVLGVYGLSLVLLFGSSSAYHLIQAGPEAIGRLRKLDHAAIYGLIAGSYTPICAIMFSGFWRWGFLAVIWSLAAAGIIVKMFIIKAPRWITAGVYVLLGWLSLAAAAEARRALPAGALIGLAVGGLIYTIGAVIYITKKLDLFPGKFGFHEVWHIFVILAALAHYITIAVYVAPPRR
jgi:hemolysin III